MRTVSFSNDQVQQQLQNRFVSTFSNTDGDPTAGKSIWHSPQDSPGHCIQGNGKQNVQTIFMTPNQEIFHVATGFLPPSVLAQEIDFASELFETLKSRDVDPQEIVRVTHQDRLRDLGFDEQRINSNGSPLEMMGGMGTFPEMVGSNQRRQPFTGQAGFDPFAPFVRQQVLDDNRFSVRYPMMKWQTLQNDPTNLVGNGTSFFASSSSR